MNPRRGAWFGTVMTLLLFAGGYYAGWQGYRWQISTAATRGYHAETPTLTFLIILPLGLLITRLSYLYLRQLASSRAEIEGEVVIRTDQLARAKTEWERTFDSVPDLIMLLDRESRIIRVNRAQAERLGCSPVELVGKRCHTVLYGTATPPDSCPHQLLLRDGRAQYLERCVPCLGGDFAISVTPLHDDSGKVVGSVHVARDISELERAKQELDQSRRHLQIMLDNLPMTAWLKDREGRFLMVNEQFAQAAGRPRREILGLTSFDIWPLPLAEHYHAIDEEIIATKESRQVEELLAHVRGESWFEAFKAPVTDADGLVVGTTGIARDITKRKQNEALIQQHQRELESLNSHLEERIAGELARSRARDLLVIQEEKLASLGQLAAGVAHEMNTPLGFALNNIRLFADYFRQICSYLTLQQELLETTTEAEQRQNLAAMAEKLEIPLIVEDGPALISEAMEGVERVSHLVRDLKSFSRVDSPELDLTDLTLCMENASSVMTHELKNVATVSKEYGDLPWITCHTGQINLVFMNLLLNAVQSVTPPGRITLKSWHDDEFVYASVSDNGHGIPETSKQRIFQPFFTTREVGKGAGLGLSISHDIVSKHRGEILLESHPGGGSVFTVKLPRNDGTYETDS